LEHPRLALVPEAKAIQFLGYDIHADHFPLLRRIVERRSRGAARREAIRLLAADPKARPLLIRILGDKEEKTDVRRASAVALQSLAPSAFEELARKIALDDNEDEQLRATSISSLTTFSKSPYTSLHSAFTRRVKQLHAESISPEMRRATKSYMAKFD
jgi:hypothetical protein